MSGHFEIDTLANTGLLPLRSPKDLAWRARRLSSKLADFVSGYEASSFSGVGAPKGTAAEIADKLNREINAGLADPKMKARLAGLGVEPMQMTPNEFGKFIGDETEKWGKAIRAANIKAE